MGKDWREEFGGQGLPHEWATVMIFFYCSMTVKATTLGAVGAIFLCSYYCHYYPNPK
jgi:hypothetical protein